MHTTLVSCSGLAASLGDPDWLVYDCRNDLVARRPDAADRARLAALLLRG